MSRLKAWSDDIDPATIPDSVILSERGRRNSRKRANPAGGRRPILKPCGDCGEELNARQRRGHKCDPRRQAAFRRRLSH